VKVKIYVEGGGNSKEEHVRCREGFRKLVERAGFTRAMPAFVAGGGRERTYDLFQRALRDGETDTYPIVLVDSEEAVAQSDETPQSPAAWHHLKRLDNWERPIGAQDDQAQLMVTCMETWLMADRPALLRVFGAGLQESALLPTSDLETRSREEVQGALENATKACGRAKVYSKGRRSFQVLGLVDPALLQRYLPHFRRFVATLAAHCGREATRS
jgi:hypothetical protein